MNRKTPKRVIIRPIHKIKADVKISCEVRGRKFTLNCIEMFGGKLAVKRGRFISEKVPEATITEVFDFSRRWVVAQIKKPRGLSV